MAGNRRIDIDIVANDRASQVFNSVGSGMNSMSGKVNNAIANINSGLNRYNNAMSTIYRSTQIALGGAGYLIYRFTKDAVKQFAEFEREHGKTMGAIANNYDKTAQAQAKFMADQKKLKEDAIKLGTFGPSGRGSMYNPTQVATTQTALAKAGFNAQQIPQTLMPVIKFAGGNDLGLETAADYAVNVAEIFGVKRDQESYKTMLDKITRAADISTIDVPDIFESLKYTGPIASSLGRSLEEVLGMISVMGNAGLKGSMAGTGIQAFFTRILNPVPFTKTQLENVPSQDAMNMYEQFVKSTTTPEGKFKDMPTVTASLDEAMNQLNDKEQAWFAQKLFGLFQMKAAFTLGRNGGDPLKSVINDINNKSVGTNDNKWNIMMGTTYGKQMALGNAMTGFKADIGYRLSPITNAMMDELFRVVSNKGNYEIDYKRITKGIRDASDMIAQQYGVQFGELVGNMATMGINSVRVGGAVSPLIPEFGLGYAKLLGGDIPGALSAFNNGIEMTNDRIKDLPPELQGLAKQVRNAIATLSILAGVNFATKIIGNFTQIYTAINKLKPPTTPLVTNSLREMSVTASVVYVNGRVGGTSTAPVSGGKATPSPTPSVVLDKNGRPNGQPVPRKTIVDQYGRPIQSDPKPTPPITFGTRLMKGLNVATWAYSISEMFGINDWLLNKTSAKEGTKARENIDNARSVIDWGLIANAFDDWILKGFTKNAIKKGVTKGIPATADTLATTMGSTGMASLAMLPMIAGALVVGNEAIKNQKWLNNEKTIKDAHDNNRPTYITDDGKIIVGRSKDDLAKEREKGKYEYNYGKPSAYIYGTEPKKPAWYVSKDSDTWKKYNDDLEKYRKSLSSVARMEQDRKGRWETAQRIYTQNTGENLKWGDYDNNRQLWDKILPSGMFNNMSASLKPLYDGILSGQQIFGQLSSLPRNDDGSIDSTALKQALIGIANDSSGLSQALSIIGVHASGISGDMGTLSSNTAQMSGDMKSLADATANYINGKGVFNGQQAPDMVEQKFPWAKGLRDTNSSLYTILSQLTGDNGSASMGSKLDTINTSIVGLQGQVPIVNVSAPRVDVTVNVDKSGNVTKSVITQPGPLDDLFRWNSSRFGGGGK